MRVLFAFASVVLLGCAENTGGNPASATAPAAETSSYRVITTQAEFNSLVVGRQLTYQETNTFTIRADGTLDGDFNGPLAGTWRWAEGYWCRTLTVPERPQDCQVWETDGVNLRATRDEGGGASFIYTL